jgi:hypothetical protein
MPFESVGRPPQRKVSLRRRGDDLMPPPAPPPGPPEGAEEGAPLEADAVNDSIGDEDIDIEADELSLPLPPPLSRVAA